MQFILISTILVLTGIVIIIIAHFIPHRIRKKSILVPLRLLKNTVFLFGLGAALFCIYFYLTRSVWESLFVALLPYLIRYSLMFAYLKEIPTPKRRWFSEMHLQNMMKTTETYPVKIILKPVIAELVHKNFKKERLLQHISLSLEEKPITEKPMRKDLRKPILDGISLTVRVNGPAFQINPKESIVLLEEKPVLVEFLVTPSKSGKHLLAVEFWDESGQRGYLRTSVHVMDFIFLGSIRVTETQIKVIRAIGYVIGVIGIIIGILSIIGVI